MRRYMNREYEVVGGPYFTACSKLAPNRARCHDEVKAGIYWRCGRISVRNSGGYDHIRARLPVGC
jgi:hypothetical protein